MASNWFGTSTLPAAPAYERGPPRDRRERHVSSPFGGARNGLPCRSQIDEHAASSIVTRTHMRIQAVRRIHLQRCVILMLTMAWVPEVSAEALSPHAHGKHSGFGWECDPGYREVERSCEPIVLPPGGDLEPLGREWRCDRGYQKVVGLCATIDAYPNGFLTANATRRKPSR